MIRPEIELIKVVDIITTSATTSSTKREDELPEEEL